MTPPSFYRDKAAEVAQRAYFAATEDERERLTAEARSWLQIARTEQRLFARERAEDSDMKRS